MAIAEIAETTQGTTEVLPIKRENVPIPAEKPATVNPVQNRYLIESSFHIVILYLV